jgi:hypothetical protein
MAYRRQSDMKKKFRVFCLYGVFIVLIGFLATCKVKTEPPLWGDVNTGLTLTYRLPVDQPFKYKISSETNQIVEMMGSEMKTVSKSNIDFSVNTKEIQEKDLFMEVTIGDVKIEVKSAMAGNMTPDTSSMKGKTFTMKLSSLGEESDFKRTESLKYSMGMAGERNLQSTFRDIFPNLPDKPLKTGDTWDHKGDTTTKEGAINIHAISETVNTFAGLEVVDGIECAKITAKTSATFEGKGKQMGSDLVIKGESKSNSTWYFDYKTGVFVKRTSISSSLGSVKVVAQNMDLPMKTESKSEVILVK